MHLLKTRKLLRYVRLAAAASLSLFFLVRLFPLLYVAATLFLASFCSARVFWRCPYCRRFLGRLDKKQVCPHCSTYLWDGEAK